MNVSVRNIEDVFDLLYDPDSDGPGDYREATDMDLAGGYTYEHAQLPYPLHAVHLVFNRKGRYFFGAGIISASVDSAFDGDATEFAGLINGEGVRCDRGEKEEGDDESYLFLPRTPYCRYSGIIQSRGDNFMAINRIPFQDEDTDESYDSLRIELGVNGTEPINFPSSLEAFTEHVNTVTRLTNIVLTDLLENTLSDQMKPSYRKMELSFQTGQPF